MTNDEPPRITAHRWLPGEPIPYDAMRAILGLPDVHAEVQRMRADLGIRRAIAFVADTRNAMGVPVYKHPTICGACGATIVDWAMHEAFHRNLADAFKDRDKAFNKLVRSLDARIARRDR
ncbi:hypothetical protein [Rhodococcus daqingensis]|uniref:Uncharacterized protein n=1 Tax=Rhodococcus daqingensis TaxID=2479363 RepID=A0ABW2S3Q3_9NOCA